MSDTEKVVKRGRKPKYSTPEEAKAAVLEQQKFHQQKYKEQREEWREKSSALQKHVVKELSRKIFDESIINQITVLSNQESSTKTE